MNNSDLIRAFRRALRRDDDLAQQGVLNRSAYSSERLEDGRTRHTMRGVMIQTPPEYAAVYERRGITTPYSSTTFDPASLWPYEPREPHERHARDRGYFWLPCPLCGREFGGHEITDSIHVDGDRPGLFTGICPVCSAERNGGVP